MLLGEVMVATHELEEVVPVPGDVATKVQTHKSRKLDESRIDFAEEASIIKGHRRDHISPEPIGATPLGKMIDDGWVHTCVNRSAHKNHGRWHVRISGLLHERDRGEDRYRRLANGHDREVGADRSENADYVIDIIVEAELAICDWHVASIRPVGDINVMIWQHALDCIAQQSRVMASEGRNDNDFRVLI